MRRRLQEQTITVGSVGAGDDIDGELIGCGPAEVSWNSTLPITSVTLGLQQNQENGEWVEYPITAQPIINEGFLEWNISCLAGSNFSVVVKDGANEAVQGWSPPFEILGITVLSPSSDVNWTAEDIHRISWKDTSGAESFRIILNAEEGGPWDVAQDVNTSISNSTTPTYDWLFAPWIVLENDTILQSNFFFSVEATDTPARGLSGPFNIVLGAEDPGPHFSAVALIFPVLLLLMCGCMMGMCTMRFFEMRDRARGGPSRNIMLDDLYVIDGEGQPAVLALDAHPVLLAHAEVVDCDTTLSKYNSPRCATDAASEEDIELGDGDLMEAEPTEIVSCLHPVKIWVEGYEGFHTGTQGTTPTPSRSPQNSMPRIVDRMRGNRGDGSVIINAGSS